ncbi:hypothetical protein [Paractinoplanes lichenicola]|uniref:Uncharacterized protein n=1 Tax=Paractinoplanes lichenicola TaxID=2802976 RepID=A0ABS1W4B5_9ACTN|nr:hypothetical protein [Actinoplanes lichenicola]MBL7261568.1 hypothetical protein [Actinoplanes lichenicola]
MSSSSDCGGAADYVRSYLQAPFLADEARRLRALEIVRAGGRVVVGGMISADRWELRDWLTDELVREGSAGPVSLLGLCHADTLYADGPEPEVETVPLSLRRALEDWVCEPATPDEDIAAFVGWPVGRVRELR